MKISTALVTHNSTDILEYSCKSILEQKIENVQLDVVLFDNGSIDGGRTLGKLKDWAIHFNYKNIPADVCFRAKKEEEITAFFYAAKLCKGDWVCFLPGNGFYDLNYIENLNHIIDKYYSLNDTILSAYDIVDMKRNQSQIYYPSIWRNKEIFAFEQNIQLSDPIGICIKKNMLSRYFSEQSEILYDLYVKSHFHSIAYNDKKAGTLIIGENVDKSKRKNILNGLYTRAS